MSKVKFQPELLAAAHIDYQIKVHSIGNFPSELLTILLTGAFPLSPSPTSGTIDGLKVFTAKQRYLCFCLAIQADRKDEMGRKTSSSRVLILPLDLWHGLLPSLADIREWLSNHDVENMSEDQFHEEISVLENATLSPDLVKKAQETNWFPSLLAKLVQQKKTIIVAKTQAEAVSWLEILWYYTPDFLRLHIGWSTYVWSLRTEHEEVVATVGTVDPPPKQSVLQWLFKKSAKQEVEFLFDVSQGISSQNTDDLDLIPLKWLCKELVYQEQWQHWELEKQRQFLLESLERLSRDPETKLSSLTSGYPRSPKLEEFVKLLDQKK